MTGNAPKTRPDRYGETTAALLSKPGILILVRINQRAAFIRSTAHAEMVGQLGLATLRAGGDAGGGRFFMGSAHIAF